MKFEPFKTPFDSFQIPFSTSDTDILCPLMSKANNEAVCKGSNCQAWYYASPSDSTAEEEARGYCAFTHGQPGLLNALDKIEKALIPPSMPAILARIEALEDRVASLLVSQTIDAAAEEATCRKVCNSI